MIHISKTTYIGTPSHQRHVIFWLRIGGLCPAIPHDTRRVEWTSRLAGGIYRACINLSRIAAVALVLPEMRSLAYANAHARAHAHMHAQIHPDKRLQQETPDNIWMLYVYVDIYLDR
jgi:uncharacterized protein involved in high-affinity Fe2+ transport